MRSGGCAASLAAGVAAGIGYLIVLAATTRSSAEIYLLFAFLSLPAGLLTAAIAYALRKKLSVFTASAAGLAFGCLLPILMFVGLQASADVEAGKARERRVDEGRSIFASMLKAGFPDLGGMSPSSENYQLDAGPSVYLKSTQSAAATCDSLRGRLSGWQEARFSKGCWFGRLGTTGHDQIRVREEGTASHVTYVLNGEYHKTAYRASELFCTYLKAGAYEDASALVAPEYLAALGGPAGLKSWVTRRKARLGQVNLYARMDRYGQQLTDGRMLVLTMRGGLPRVAKLDTAPDMNF